MAVRYFHHALDGDDFIVSAKHRPPVYALWNYSDRHSPEKKPRWIMYSSFPRIFVVFEAANVAANTWLRRHSNSTATELISHSNVSTLQRSKRVFKSDPKHTNLCIAIVQLTPSTGVTMRDNSRGYPRPVVPTDCENQSWKGCTTYCIQDDARR
ncbi:hypothetical protein P879_00982 [Paragonimus westermani]|uniref:Uncharacterized protein n=1 Tax=Paragonimus westermani TaxID=34504 RepID=A0A8T0DT04_9TREM|nr:hypothetical protein P879_00982 [Paragonimus westermani]